MFKEKEYENFIDCSINDTDSLNSKNTSFLGVDEIMWQHSSHYQKLQILKERIFYYFNNFNAVGVYSLTEKAAKINLDTPYNIVALHYFLIDSIKLLFQLRDKDPAALDLCLKACDLNIAIYHSVRKEIDFIYTEALSRKAKIYESRGDFISAIKVCDYGIENNYVDINRKSYIFRKERLLLRLKKQEKSL